MRCKVGDLAILLGPAVPKNLGALVEVLRLDDEPGYWWVRSLGGLRARDDGVIALESIGNSNRLFRHARPYHQAGKR